MSEQQQNQQPQGGQTGGDTSTPGSVETQTQGDSGQSVERTESASVERTETVTPKPEASEPDAG